MSDIVITGGNGFIGQALARHFARAGEQVISLARHAYTQDEIPNIKKRIVPGYALQGWGGEGIIRAGATLIHTAGRAHHAGEKGNAALLYLEENVYFPLHLARLAQREGARRFVFLSSIGAALLEAELAQGLSMDAAWAKQPYRASKLEAERQLLQLAQETGFEIICIRMPLVYGRGAPGNMQMLLGWMRKGWPLPCASIKNERAFLSVENLAHFMAHIMEVPAPLGIWAIRDADMLSTPAFIRALGAAAGLSPRLFACPVFLLKLAGLLLGRRGQVESLTESLAINLAPVTEKLGWQPPFGTAEGLRRAFL